RARLSARALPLRRRPSGPGRGAPARPAGAPQPPRGSRYRLARGPRTVRRHALERQRQATLARRLTMSQARVFRRAEMTLKPAVTPSGATAIARVIDTSLSAHMGGGIEVLEDVTIDWTVTYDEILFILEGPLTVAFDGR